MIVGISITAVIALYLIGMWMRDAMRNWKKQKATQETIDVLKKQNEIAAKPPVGRDDIIDRMRDGKL